MPKKTVKIEKLDNIKKFYIEGNLGKKSIEDIAADLKIPIETVEAFVEELTAAPKEKRGKSRHIIRDGSVVATEASSLVGDRVVKNKKKFTDTFSKNIHKIRPDEPIH